MTANRFLIKFTVALIMTMALPLVLLNRVEAKIYDGSQDIEMVTGDIQTVKVKNLARLSITNPEIADVSDAQAEEVTLMAKEPGKTVLFVWDEDGKRAINIRVVSEDLSVVKARIAQLVQKAEIHGVTIDEDSLEGRVIVTGALEEEDKEKMDKILEAFEESVINMIKQKVYQDQIQIDVQITELNESLTRNLGFNWGTGKDGVGTSDFAVGFQETLPTTDGSFGDLFKIGDFNRAQAIVNTVNAFIKEGKAKVLSKPRLVVVSGKEASFLVGGEIPIKQTTLNNSGGSVTEDVTFKQYGVNMNITPTIKNGRIEIELNVEVSDVDASNAQGDEVAFLTRNATTYLNLADRQTIVLAGLIKRSKSEEVKRIPFVSKIPIVGLLFRNNSTPVPNQETELVISLTPTILKDMMTPEKVETKKVVSTNSNKTTNSQSSPDNQVISAGYAQALQAKISSAINYPYEAKENGWEGTVKLGLHILKDGTLANVTVKESSGHSIFDEDAVNTAKILAPYPTFSSDMVGEDVVVVVPIVYSQKTDLNKT
ncbi:MAG: TonB family protein [Candidatus Omnitrophica bacterium]|nr:TonB family protein [Candidatus Omnitrophota bacterium]